MDNAPLRIGFMGTPDFAVGALAALCEARYNVVCVYSQPPRPKGRGKKVQPSPVHAYAEDKGLPVYTPVNFKSEEAKAEFASHNMDVAIVAAYGLILPEAVLDAPTYGCLNIHASLLPRWRGAAPIQYAIWKGDKDTGVTIMQMERGLDTGPMIAKQAVPIAEDTTAPLLHDALSELGAKMIVDVVGQLELKRAMLEAVPQDDALSNYASMLKKEDGIVDWSASAADIDRQIRALNPWPGVWTQANGKRLKILKAALSPFASQGQEGVVLNKDGDVQTGDGLIRLITVQPEGKAAMDLASALNGNYLNIGDVLG